MWLTFEASVSEALVREIVRKRVLDFNELDAYHHIVICCHLLCEQEITILRAPVFECSPNSLAEQ